MTGQCHLRLRIRQRASEERSWIVPLAGEMIDCLDVDRWRETHGSETLCDYIRYPVGTMTGIALILPTPSGVGSAQSRSYGEERKEASFRSKSGESGSVSKAKKWENLRNAIVD